MAGSMSKGSWIVAASVGAVEALKDQAGLCRWNHVLRYIHQHAKTIVGSSFSQANNGRVSAAAANSAERLRKNRRSEERAKQSEESLRTVMYLSCWGPN